MVTLASLWLPILLSAVLVFIASSLIHTVLGWHASDFAKLPDEDKVLDALREAGASPGEYIFPRADDPKDQMGEEMVARWKAGPAGKMTIMRGEFNMPKQLGQWFVYTLVVGLFVAYVLSRTVAAGAEYMAVFQIASTVAFLTYVGCEPVYSIWWQRSWTTTFKNAVDGLVYALLTAGVFGWQWPAA